MRLGEARGRQQQNMDGYFRGLLQGYRVAKNQPRCPGEEELICGHLPPATLTSATTVPGRRPFALLES